MLLAPANKKIGSGSIQKVAAPGGSGSATLEVTKEIKSEFFDTVTLLLQWAYVLTSQCSEYLEVCT